MSRKSRPERYTRPEFLLVIAASVACVIAGYQVSESFFSLRIEAILVTALNGVFLFAGALTVVHNSQRIWNLIGLLPADQRKTMRLHYARPIASRLFDGMTIGAVANLGLLRLLTFLEISNRHWEMGIYGWFFFYTYVALIAFVLKGKLLEKETSTLVQQQFSPSTKEAEEKSEEKHIEEESSK